MLPCLFLSRRFFLIFRFLLLYAFYVCRRHFRLPLRFYADACWLCLAAYHDYIIFATLNADIDAVLRYAMPLMLLRCWYCLRFIWFLIFCFRFLHCHDAAIIVIFDISFLHYCFSLRHAAIDFLFDISLFSVRLALFLLLLHMLFAAAFAFMFSLPLLSLLIFFALISFISLIFRYYTTPLFFSLHTLFHFLFFACFIFSACFAFLRRAFHYFDAAIIDITPSLSIRFLCHFHAMLTFALIITFFRYAMIIAFSLICHYAIIFSPMLLMLLFRYYYATSLLLLLLRYFRWYAAAFFSFWCFRRRHYWCFRFFNMIRYYDTPLFSLFSLLMLLRFFYCCLLAAYLRLLFWC